MEMTQCRELGFLSGTGGLRRKGKMWKMIPGAGDLPRARLRKMLDCPAESARRSPPDC